MFRVSTQGYLCAVLASLKCVSAIFPLLRVFYLFALKLSTEGARLTAGVEGQVTWQSGDLTLVRAVPSIDGT